MNATQSAPVAPQFVSRFPSLGLTMAQRMVFAAFVKMMAEAGRAA